VTFLKVAVLPGSIRAASMNRQLAAALVPTLARHGVAGEVVDLADYPMPLYHGDEEAEHGQPASAVALHDRLAGFDGLIFVSPEYNGGPSALLKNTIDWVTRVDRAVFKPLLIGLAATSPGPRGARNGLAVLRSICDHMRLDLVPDDLSIGQYGDAFELVDGTPTLVRSHDIEATERFVAGYAAALRERSGVESTR
jgi:NAD(P)H-dependent FMN reductase